MMRTARRKILIADDDRALVGVLAAQLSAAGYEVVSAVDGRYAFDRIVQDRPDLVILDIHMPQVSGFNLLERMYKISGLDRIPVIYVTGDVSEDVERTARHFGACAVLGKPFEISHLLQLVAKALGQPSGPAPAGPGSQQDHDS
jgi:CheY-like chemotaxis protein